MAKIPWLLNLSEIIYSSLMEDVKFKYLREYVITMKVAILFSGGKDSCQAVDFCKKKGWEVKALIAVKPKNTEAYLWHYATVEWSTLSAEAMGIPLILVKCNEIGPEEEAKELEEVFRDIRIDALALGGVGLQKTQIRAVRDVAKKFGIEVLVPYEEYTSEELLDEEIRSGHDILITDVAADGLGPEWLGRRLDKETIEELKTLSENYGFDPLGEGGSFNTFVVNGPTFKKKIEFVNSTKVWDDKTHSGYLEVSDAILISK